MKSNFNELFESRIADLRNSSDIDIEKELDEMIPQIRFEEIVTRSELVRAVIRSRLTSALNINQMYSFEKGHFIHIDNASEEQLAYFMDKAKRDIAAAEVRKSKAESMLMQISMAWDSEGNFIGLHIPDRTAVNE